MVSKQGANDIVHFGSELERGTLLEQSHGGTYAVGYFGEERPILLRPPSRAA